MSALDAPAGLAAAPVAAPMVAPTFAGPLPAETVSAQQQWERRLRADIESTLHEAMRTLRFALESRLQQELNAGLANALHDASPAVQQALVRRVGSWSAQLPPPSVDPWAAWITGLLDATEPPRILQALFAAAATLAPRLAIYVVRGSAAIAWRCAGLEAPARIELANDHIFARAIHLGHPVHWGPATAPWAGHAAATGSTPAASSGTVYPLSVRHKTIALLCHQSAATHAGESGRAPESGPDARLAVLTRVATLSLEQAMNQSGAMGIHHAPETDSQDHAAPAKFELEPAAPAIADDEATAPDVTASAAGTGGESLVEFAPAPPALPDEPAAADVRGVNVPGAGRARRFAKVLAQDLELYLQRDHPEALAAARAQQDLYGQLREDLDKCRQSFLERFPAGTGPGLEILDAQLVAILAQGNAAALGPSYPFAA
ncbi:MAG: hypothetical protein ACRD13_06490 [Terriglobales bacterium]